MSLLMEALRKAEEAKRKDKNDTGTDSVVDEAYPLHSENGDELSEEAVEEAGLDTDPSSEETPESKNLQVEFDAAIAQHPEFDAEDDSVSEVEDSVDGAADGTAEEALDSSDQKQWPDLDLHPMSEESEDSEPEIDNPAGLSASDLDNASVTQDSAETDSPSEDFPAESMGEPQSEESAPAARVLIDDADPFEDEDNDPIETAAWQSRARRLVNPKRYNRFVLILILLLPVGGLLYWLFAPEAAPVIASVSPDRGFLGQTPEEVLAEEQALQEDVAQPLIASGDIEGEAISQLELVSDNSESFVIGEDLGVAQGEPVQIQPAISAQVEQSKIFQITPASRFISSDLAGNLEAAQNSDGMDARVQYESILAEQPNNADALLGLARLDISEGNTESARSIYRRLQQLNPQDPLAQAGLLQVDLAADPLSQEIELKSLVANNPDIAPLSFALGNLFASQRRWNEAEGAYSDALASAKFLDGNSIHPDYAFNLAVTLEQLNQQYEALTYYQEALILSEQYTPSFDLNVLNSRINFLGRIL